MVKPNARGGALNASYGHPSAGNRITGLVGDDKRELLADLGRGQTESARSGSSVRLLIGMATGHPAPGSSDTAVGRVRGAVGCTPDGGRPH